MFTMPRKVRDVMGLENDESISDRELEELIKIAQEEVKRELFIYHYNEEVNSNPYTGASWNGSNVTFQTTSYPIMDDDNDFDVTNSDVTVRWLSKEYNPSQASWTIRSDVWGLVNIYQSDGATAIPSDAETVRIDYWACPIDVNSRQLSDLTAYLAAHLTIGRLKSGTSINIADFRSNRPVILKTESQFLDKYKMLLRTLQGDIIKGV